MRAAALLVCVACGGATLAPVVPTFEIHDRGAEPRALLRYEHTANASDRYEATMKVRTTTKFENTVLEEGTSLLDLPAIVARGSMTVTQIAPDGAATIREQIDSTTVLEDVIDRRVRRELVRRTQHLAGTSYVWGRTPQGKLTGGTNELADAIRLSTPAFPDEPVGVGASWTVSSAYSASGIEWRRATTFTLRDRTNDTVTIDATTALVANDQVVQAEPNATTRLTSGVGNATVHMVIPLRGLVGETSGQESMTMNVLITRGRTRIKAQTTVETIMSSRALGQ